MKSLNVLRGSEKARLLHEMFPDEIPALLEDICSFCEDFKTNKADYRSRWSSPMMSFDYWQNLAVETADLIQKYEFTMKRSSRVFSEQLYCTYTSLFVTDRIIKYADKVSTNEKFKLMVQVLFT